jgi:hypothetical protein
MCLNGSVLGQPALSNIFGILSKIMLSRSIAAASQAMSVPEIPCVGYLEITPGGKRIFDQTQDDLQGNDAVDD